MLIPLSDLRRTYELAVTGILHVGAHRAEERQDYLHLGVKKIVWVEANKQLASELKINNRDKVICAVVSDTDGEEVTFHTANNGQSSSILELGTHKTAHPEVHYVSDETRSTERLDTIMADNGLDGLNFLNLDIQGAELKALMGLGDRLKEFDYIYSEVNREPLYVGCAQVDEIDAHLSEFRRVQTVWTEFGWGDAFYLRVSR